MERPQIVAAIAAALAEVLGAETPELAEDSRLFEDLYLDSVGILGLLMLIEDNVGIMVDPEGLSMETFETVGTLADYVESCLHVTA